MKRIQARTIRVALQGRDTHAGPILLDLLLHHY
jgi:hypothetical protein